MRCDLRDNAKLYEFPEYWDATILDDHMRKKIDLMLSIIPQDVRTVLDLGCGHGITTNIFAKKFEVTAVDRSKYALEHVKCQKKYNCGIMELDIQPESNDLVLLSEVLEHLSEDDFNGIIKKIKSL